ncbi:putative FAD synthetase [Xylariaceae sp. FL0016]|nr:putative FAD synthetase [Xylariaceae sp. FL0016]
MTGGDVPAPRTNGAGPSNPSASRMEDLCRDLKLRVDALLERQTDDKILKAVQAQVRIAKGVVEDALRRYKPEELSVSYNGGKDCLVLLILILASLPTVFPPTRTNPSGSTPPSSSSFPSSLQALYIRPALPFAEVDDFVRESSAHYGLDLTTSNSGMKTALTAYLAERPRVRAVFVGTRRTDPHGARLTFFDETDADWPRFMRIHPVIDWHYREVWGFIRALEIPYCPLYDMGYTSLGSTNDTHPNPALRADPPPSADSTTATSGREQFRPAYELMEDDEERLGRDR